MTDLRTVTQKYVATADTSGLDKYAASADKAAASTKKFADANTAVASATTKSEKSALGVATQLDRMTKAADPAAKALATLERYQRLVGAATQQGLPVTAEYTRTLETLRARHAELSKATDDHTAKMGLNRAQMFELSHVARSLFDDFASGISPIRAFAQEGGRIAQVLGEGNGGAGATLRAMGGSVARLATGWLGLGAAVAAGAGLAAAAVVRFQSQQDRLALSLNGAGRFAGVGLGGLTGIANAAGARNAALGQGGATSLTATLAATGRISAGIMPGILDLATPYARGTGQDISKAGEELAKAFADPGKGADELNAKLGFLDDRTKQLIGSLERQGDLLGAQQVLLEHAADAAAHMADRTWTIAKAWGAIENAVGGAFNSIGSGIERAVNGPNTQDRLSAAYADQARRRGAGSGFGMGFSSFNTSSGAAAQNQILGLNYQLYGESRGASDSAARAASDKATNDLSLAVGEAVRKALPEVDKTQELTDTLKLLDDAIRNPETAGKVKGGASAISLAAGRTGNLLANSDPLQRISQDSALAVQAAQAQTGAERTLVEARRAELEVLRSTGDATQAAAKSLAAWNEAIAKSNKEAEDALRSATQRAGLVGQSTLGRALRENEYRYEELRRGAVTGPVSSLDGAFTALDDRTTPLARAMALGSKGSSPALSAAAALGTRDFGFGARPGDAWGPDFAYNPSRRASYPVSPALAAIGSNAGAVARIAPGNIVIPSTSGGTLRAAQSVDTGAIMDQMTIDRVRQSTEELKRNQELLDVRTRSIGSSTDAMTKAIHVQEDWNQLQLTDNDKKLLGTQRVKQLGDSIDTLASKQTSYDKQQQQYDQLVNASSSFQSIGSSFVGGAADSIFSTWNSNPRDLVGQLSTGDQMKYYSGQMSGNQVKDKIRQSQIQQLFASILEKQGVSMIETGLFGKGTLGSPGYSPGLLGGAFNGLLGGLLGGGSSAVGGGAGGGIFGGIAKLFGFADGGVMTSAGPMPLRRYAGGGIANSPQVAMFGEGSGPEAYVPLAGGRHIPVKIAGGAGAQVHMGGSTIVIQGNADEKTASMIDARITAANSKMLSDLQRNIGPMMGKYNQRNG